MNRTQLSVNSVFTYKGKPLPTQEPKRSMQRLNVLASKIFVGRTYAIPLLRGTGKRETPTHELQQLGSWKITIMMERYAHMGQDDLLHAAKRLDNLTRSFISVTRNEKGE
ncbi:MAG: hypothetical protein Q4A11_02715 [Brachymonas sp.]|nr:hypothetical protein [Brachymonas sp.]